jgi:hypothetical protein
VAYDYNTIDVIRIPATSFYELLLRRAEIRRMISGAD